MGIPDYETQSLRRWIKFIVFAGISAGAVAQGTVRAGDLSAKQVRDSIGRAKQMILKAQRADGSWPGGPNDAYTTGGSSVALLVLINAGMTAANPEIERGLNWLRRQQPTLTYEISLMIQALAAAREGERDGLIVTNLARELEETQIRQGPNAGSWTYNRKLLEAGSGDRSNGHFAILALRDAQDMGVRVARETWERARSHWLIRQNEDGGWGYDEKRTTSTGSMTAEGIATLVTTQAMLRGGAKELDAKGLPICRHDRAIEAAVEDACRWMGSHFAANQNPGDPRWLLYYLSALERAGRLSGRRFFVDSRGEKQDWYRAGAEYLLTQQSALTGAWDGMGTDNQAAIGTSFALMFLSQGLAPVLINKLQYGRRDRKGSRIVGDDWNRHYDDVGSLTRFISSRPDWPKLVTWQTVDISQATVAELLQAPILFFTGSDAPQFTGEDVVLLRDYLEQGGFLFVDRCGKGQKFDKQFRELVRRLYPPRKEQLKKLTAEHLVYHSEFDLLDDETGKPTAELWGLEIGGRTRIIYSPDGLSCLWSKWTPFEVPDHPKELVSMIDKATRVGANVAAYATARKLPDKLDRGGE